MPMKRDTPRASGEAEAGFSRVLERGAVLVAPRPDGWETA